MKTVKQLIEEINALVEDEFVDEFVDAEIAGSELVDAPVESATDELNAKTKISRALDVLADAIEDFKNATVSEINLITDADLGVSIESLDSAVAGIREVLNGKAEEAPIEEPLDLPMELEEPVEEDEQDEQDEEELDFDDEAGLDLFSDEE